MLRAGLLSQFQEVSATDDTTPHSSAKMQDVLLHAGTA